MAVATVSTSSSPWGPSGKSSRMNNQNLIFTLPASETKHYRTSEEVEETYNTYLRYKQVHRQPTRAMVDQLKELQKVLEAQEQAFYSKFGYSNLLGFKQACEKWRSEAAVLLEHNSAEYLTAAMSGGDTLPFQSPQEIFNELDKVLQQQFYPSVGKRAQAAASVALQNAMEVLTKTNSNTTSARIMNIAFHLEKDKFGGSSTQSIYGKSASKHGTGVYNLITFAIEDGKLTWHINDGELEYVTRDELKKVATKTLDALGKKGPAKNKNASSVSTNVKDPKNNRDAVIEVFDKIFAARLSSNALQICHTAILNKGLGLTYNFSNVSGSAGFLGELYWYGAFKAVFGSAADFLPTGSWYNLKDKQMGIDIVLKSALDNGLPGLGFQVKNWSTTMKGEVESYTTPPEKRYLGNFLETNELTDALVGDLLCRMFGSASYNKPNAKWADDNYDNYISFWHQMYSETQQIETINDILQHYIVNISHIAKEDEERGEHEIQGAYRNTFWLINDKILPSSIVVEAMWKALLDRTNNPYIYLYVDRIKETATEVNGSWPRRPKDGSYSDISMANRWEIKYHFEFHLSELAKAAEDAAKASGKAVSAK